MKRILTVAATTLALLVPAASFADAGRVQFVYGDVRIAGADGAERRARRGDVVEEGDTITSGRRSAAQVRMVDGAALAVRASSQVRIDSYRYQSESGEDRSFLSLLRGTMRAITGLIGRNNRDGYRVSTKTATIGIRGSDADIGFNPDTGLAAVRTNVGGHSFTSNSTGETLQTNVGQIVSALPGQSPGFVPTFPFATPTPAAGPGGRTVAGGGGGSGGQGDGLVRDDTDDGNADRRRGRNGSGARRSFVGQVANGIARAGQTPGSLGGQGVANQAQQENSFTSAPDGSFAVGAYFEVIPLGGTAKVGNTRVGATGAEVFVDSNNNVVGLRDTDGGNVFVFDGRTATLGSASNVSVRNAQSVEVGKVRFGYWTNGFTVTQNGVTTNTVDNFHFALANNLTSVAQIGQLGGTAFSYSPIGGTATNETGAQASSLTGNISGTFASNATLGTISVSIQANFPTGSSNWNLATGGTVANFIQDSGLTLVGGCCGGSGANGTITGRFVGTAAEGVAASFAAEQLGANRIAGTFVGER